LNLQQHRSKHLTSCKPGSIPTQEDSLHSNYTVLPTSLRSKFRHFPGNVPLLLKKSPAFQGTQGFTTLITAAHHLSRS